MNKNVVIIIVLFLLNTVIAVSYFSLKKTYNQVLGAQGIQAILASDYLTAMKYNNMQINEVTAKNVKDSAFTLPQLCTAKYTLVMRYSYIHCNACVDSIMVILNDFSKQTGIKPLILSQYANRRDYINFVRVNQIKQPIYCVEDTLCIADNLDVPYLFVLDSDMKCNNFFIPRKEYTKGAKMYLNSIRHLLE